MRSIRRLSEFISILSVLAFAMFVYFLIVVPGFSFVAMLIFLVVLNTDLAEGNRKPRKYALISGLLSVIAGVLLHFVFGLSVFTSVLFAFFLLIQFPFRRWIVVERK